MENPEEILHSLEEFSKMKPKDIPKELEEYLKFVAKTGDPVYQWTSIKSLFREKLINVITEFYESCPTMEIPPCPNVDMFNYDLMKTFILEKLETFSSAPFTLQRICELLTSPRKEYTRIDKYMRALEKNILVVSTMEPGGRRTENGEGIMNGIESDHDHVPEPGNEINVEEMDDSPSWPQSIQNNHISESLTFESSKTEEQTEISNSVETYSSEKVTSEASTSNQEIVCVQYVSIERLSENLQTHQAQVEKEIDVSVTITAVNVENPLEEPSRSREISEETQECVEKQETELTEIPVEQKQEVEAKMDVADETIFEPEPKEIIEINPIPESTTQEVPATIELLRKQSETSPEISEFENISPESSVSSSENSPSTPTTQSETSSTTMREENENTILETTIRENLEQTKENPELTEDTLNLTENASGDNKVDADIPESKKEETTTNPEVSLTLDASKEILVGLDENKCSEVDSVDTECSEVDSFENSASSESAEKKGNSQEDKTEEQPSSTDEQPSSTDEQPSSTEEQPSSTTPEIEVHEEQKKLEEESEKDSDDLDAEEKETPMEVDMAIEKSEKEESTPQEPVTEPPV